MTESWQPSGQAPFLAKWVHWLIRREPRPPLPAPKATSGESRTVSFHEALENGDAWATSFLLATAQVLGRRVMAMNEELLKLSAELRPNLAQPQIRRAVAEIEELRKRLTTEWTF